MLLRLWRVPTRRIRDLAGFMRSLIWQKWLCTFTLVVLLLGLATLLNSDFQVYFRGRWFLFLGVTVLAWILIVMHVLALFRIAIEFARSDRPVIELLRIIRPETVGYLKAVTGKTTDALDRHLRRASILAHLEPRLLGLRMTLLVVWAIHVTICVALYSLTVITLQLVDNCQFANLDLARDGITRAVYFTVVTLATIGYGDVWAKGTQAEVLVMMGALLSLSLWTFGVGFIVSDFFLVTSKLEAEVDRAIPVP